MGLVVLSKRERPIVILPMGKGLLGKTLHYPPEVRGEADYFADIQEMSPPDMLEIAGRIVDMKAAGLDPALLEDRYRTALVGMLREKQSKLPQLSATAAPSGNNVINLMDILKRSVVAESSKEPPPHGDRSLG